MATPTREAVFEALLALIQANVSIISTDPLVKIKTYTRRMTLPGNVDPEDCPQLQLWAQPEDTEDKGNAVPPKRTWNALIVLVIRNPDKQLPGASLIYPVLDQIDTLQQNPQTDVQTLGGLVFWVKIIGKTVIETGDTDPNGLGGAVVPIKILVP